MNSKIIAVLPTYNSSPLIQARIKELQNRGVKKIVVCDDNSSDGTVDNLKKNFGDNIKVVAGNKNLGPGGNRNRGLPFLKDNEIALFIDADCEIIYKFDIPVLVQKSFKNPDIGVVGFSILNKNNSPMEWNYGELMHPVYDARSHQLYELFKKGDITKQQFIKYAPSEAASYRMLPEENTKNVEWVAEGCMAIRASTFKKIEGFAEEMRYHETQDLCLKVKQTGKQVIFNPVVLVKHLDHDSRLTTRQEDFRKGQLYYFEKHWGMSKEVFNKLYGDIY